MTIKLQLDLDFVVSDEDRKTPNSFLSTNRTISEWMLKRAIDAKLKDGVDRKGDSGVLQDQVADLLENITIATKKNENEIGITIQDLRLLNDCMREWRAPPSWLMWVRKVARNLDKTLRDYEAAEDAKKRADQELKKAEAAKA